jgi:hypothetical protein
MNRYEANQILDKAREGHPCSEARALQCLYITGDAGVHAPVRSEGVDDEASPEDWRGRIRSRAIVVGRSKK